MAASTGLGDLKTSEWQELQQIADRFEKAWQKVADQGEPPDLARFLPPPQDPLRKLVLHELIKTDLEARWRRNLSTGIEFYLQRFAELGKAKELPASLLYEEYRIRHSFGDKPPMTAYQRRFPDQFDEFQRLVGDEPMATNLVTITAPPPPAPPTAKGLPISSNVGTVTPSAGETLVGGYVKKERIGSGSFGEVWRAEAPGGVPCAIKVLTRPVDHETAQRELESLELIKSIRHPFLLQTQRFDISEERLYIIMELADGSLRSRLKECRKEGHNGIPLEELIPYFHESAEALDFLHSKKIQHRDVKPDNILLLERHVKVADFGLARLQGERSLMTATSSGTPAYMGPEVWSGKFSEHSDQYALAFTYAELRLDRRVFPGVSLPEMMNDHLNTTPDLAPMPEAEKEVVLRAMSKDPTKRFPSCKDFAQALDLATRKERGIPMPVPEGTALSEAPTADYSQGGTDPWSTMGSPLPATVQDRQSSAGRTVPWKPPTVSRRRIWIGGFLMVGVFLATFALVKQFSPKVPGSFDFSKDPGLVQLAQGESTAITIPIRRHNFKDPVKLTFEGALDNIIVKQESDGTEAEGLPITVETKQAGRSGIFPITVCAKCGDIRHNVTLTVSTIWLPEGFKKGEGDTVKDKDGRVFYQQIVKDVGGEEVIFVCIPQGHKESNIANIPTYYIMVDKVWIGLSKKFAETNPNIRQKWKETTYVRDDRMPVTNVYAFDARDFAKWMGGQLPTAEQWDKAAGRYDNPRGEGPYEGKWSGAGSRQIALHRKSPMKVGEAIHDKSSRGCNDMAGNGEEWTNSLYDNAQLVSSLSNEDDEKIVVIQRGYGFKKNERPLHFEDLDGGKGASVGLRETDEETSFRVVLEPQP